MPTPPALTALLFYYRVWWVLFFVVVTLIRKRGGRGGGCFSFLRFMVDALFFAMVCLRFLLVPGIGRLCSVIVALPVHHLY